MIFEESFEQNSVTILPRKQNSKQKFDLTAGIRVYNEGDKRSRII